MYNQTNTPKPAASFGSVQETYKHRLDNFKSGDQITIVEDMPKGKPIRMESKRITGEKNGRKYDFDAHTYLIRISNRGYEADLELKPRDLPMLAILCPKGTENFKGSTFVFDGYNWAYMGVETTTTQAPIRNISDAMAPTYPKPSDQKDKFVQMLASKIQMATEIGMPVDESKAISFADKISPGNGIDLIRAAKDAGYIYEQNGVFKVA